jgi:hypothetical protein
MARPLRTSASREMASMRGPRPSGGKARPTEHSARPYTGVMASGCRPCGTQRWMKASSVAGLTGSAPFSARRSEAQVEAGQVGVVELLGAQLIGEVGRRREGAAMARDGLQPARRAREEGERRHQHQRHGEVERAEPGADQAHVVVERQPGDEDVLAVDLEGLAHGAQVGEQVGVRQHDALRVAGAAGGVLQEGDVVGPGAIQQRPLFAVQFLRRDDLGQARHLGAQQRRHRLRLRHGDDEGGLGVVEDARVAPEVVLDLRQARRRIDRHGYAAGQQDAEEAGEVVAAGRQHQCHRLFAAAGRARPGRRRCGGPARAAVRR